jgi:hypothetical protein
MNNEIEKKPRDFKVKKSTQEINQECLNIISEFKQKYGTKDVFFANYLGIAKDYFSLKRNNLKNFTKKDLKKLKLLFVELK